MKLFGLVLILAAANAAASEPTPPTQFVYMLKVEPQWHDKAAWTDTEPAAMIARLPQLKTETDGERVVLAGTIDKALQHLGSVSGEASDEAAARDIVVNGHPAVKADVMRATLRPNRAALQRQ